MFETEDQSRLGNQQWCLGEAPTAEDSAIAPLAIGNEHTSILALVAAGLRALAALSSNESSEHIRDSFHMYSVEDSTQTWLCASPLSTAVV